MSTALLHCLLPTRISGATQAKVPGVNELGRRGIALRRGRAWRLQSHAQARSCCWIVQPRCSQVLHFPAEWHITVACRLVHATSSKLPSQPAARRTYNRHI